MAILGSFHDADDVVQDALLTTLSRIGDVRDPAAIGSWLKAVVRNNCRMLLRSRREMPVAELQLQPPGVYQDPEEILERALTRDWVPSGLSALSVPVREVLMLRYFSSFSSYQQIADVCGVSVSVVRNRLRTGRTALVQELRARADAAYPDSGSLTSVSRREAEATVEAGSSGEYARLVRNLFHADAVLTLGGRPIGGPSTAVELRAAMMGAGVRLRIREVAACRNLMVWETEFINPPTDPEHCPAAMVWLHTLKDGRVQQLRMAYAPQAAA